LFINRKGKGGDLRNPLKKGHRTWHLLQTRFRMLRLASFATPSARQLGVFLTCYLNEGGHTVRGLAAELNVSKPAITRALDRLGELDLARRKVDPLDRRSVLVQRTPKGSAFLRDLRTIMTEASGGGKKASKKAAA
jgi:DNA-binding MarR family transcriptional regulator